MKEKKLKYKIYCGDRVVARFESMVARDLSLKAMRGLYFVHAFSKSPEKEANSGK